MQTSDKNNEMIDITISVTKEEKRLLDGFLEMSQEKHYNLRLLNKTAIMELIKTYSRNTNVILNGLNTISETYTKTTDKAIGAMESMAKYITTLELEIKKMKRSNAIRNNITYLLFFSNILLIAYLIITK